MACSKVRKYFCAFRSTGSLRGLNKITYVAFYTETATLKKFRASK